MGIPTIENPSDLLKKQVDRSKSILRESKDEILLLLDWTWPIVIANLLNNVVYLFVNMVFAGHLGKDELAGVALGNTYTFSTSAIAMGVLNAMDTLISQSFGAKNYPLIGLTVQRSMIVSLVFCGLINVLWLFTKPILVGLHQGEVVSEFAKQYVFGMIPGLYFGILLTILQKYLQGQGIMKPSIIVGIILNVFNAIFNAMLVHGFGSYDGIGVVGSALSTSISKLLACIVLFAYILYFKLHITPVQTWFGFSRETFNLDGLKEYLKLGIFAGLQMAFEGCGFEILTILAGLFESASLDAHSIAMNFTLATFMIPFSLSIALSVRIGQLLGAKKPDQAKRSTRICIGLLVCCMFVISTVQLSTRKFIGSMYTKDQEVREMVAKILPIAALFQIFDGFQTMCQGIIRGIGRNHIGAVVNFTAFYVVGMPLSCVFAFVIMKDVYGLWWGLCIGLFSAAVILGIFFARIDWKLEMKKAIERTGHDFVEDEDLERTFGDDSIEEIDINGDMDDEDSSSLKKKQKQPLVSRGSGISLSSMVDDEDIETFSNETTPDATIETPQNESILTTNSINASLDDDL